ncbi:PHP domain-containing protein [Candidatus Woesearchaeota archaeon]|nr:PHP domain-containing protein [Candidatus Woesearchaeota archaeon]
MKKADLHAHSYYSDGDFSPADVVKKAKEAGLDCIAMTDHDTINGNFEAVQAGMEYRIEVIPGVEIRSEHGEILGLFVDSDDPELDALLRKIQKSRKERIMKTVDLMSKAGYDISYDELTKRFPKFRDSTIHVITFCIEKGFFKDFWGAYREFFAEGKKFRVASDKITDENAIKAIKTAGGVAIWAHPWLDEPDFLFKNIDKFIELGLDGIEDEVSEYKPDNYEQVAEKVRNICNEKGLIISKGSDFHGPLIGAPLGRIFVDYSVVEELKRRLEK